MIEANPDSEIPSKQPAVAVGPSRRWWTGVVLVFLLQLILIFVLSSTPSPTQVRRGAVPGFILAENGSADQLELTDPTLFAMPSARSFSGQSWFRVPEHPIPAFEWVAAPEFLSLPAQPVGELFNRFVQETNLADAAVLSRNVLPPALPEMSFPAPKPRPSALKIQGALANRRLVSDTVLPPVARTGQTDFLTNTIILVSVDGSGTPFSWMLMGPGSGSVEADQAALALTRAARFEPVGGEQGQPAAALRNLTWGKLIFEWN